MTRTAGALIGRRRSSAFWGLGCPKTHHEIKDSLAGESLFFFAKRKVTKRKGAHMPRPYGSVAMLGKNGRPETRCAQTVRPANRFFLRFSLVSKRDTKRCTDLVWNYWL
ncbi:MAG: hypothetical protein ABW170_23775 [Candidatus Thiodiazotropha sp. L084R]